MKLVNLANKEGKMKETIIKTKEGNLKILYEPHKEDCYAVECAKAGKWNSPYGVVEAIWRYRKNYLLKFSCNDGECRGAIVVDPDDIANLLHFPAYLGTVEPLFAKRNANLVRPELPPKKRYFKRGART